ncbi:hypothetical protein Nepgr_030887 [Nepenthes gracilis]|uniref:Uncharacterized protein n=1 Tax=Nepenthes gracilis TaxID=150966 RepID=A0AAD3TH91_NEPGR|nr:hypothetical protein Nepgr_030887 [Nepenthes gracilis]
MEQKAPTSRPLPHHQQKQQPLHSPGDSINSASISMSNVKKAPKQTQPTAIRVIHQQQSQRTPGDGTSIKVTPCKYRDEFQTHQQTRDVHQGQHPNTAAVSVQICDNNELQATGCNSSNTIPSYVQTKLHPALGAPAIIIG